MQIFSVRYERIKFLVVGIENSLSIYAWAPRPYSKFMAFKVKQMQNPIGMKYIKLFRVLAN